MKLMTKDDLKTGVWIFAFAKLVLKQMSNLEQPHFSGFEPVVLRLSYARSSTKLMTLPHLKASRLSRNIKSTYHDIVIRRAVLPYIFDHISLGKTMAMQKIGRDTFFCDLRRHQNSFMFIYIAQNLIIENINLSI